MTRQWQSKVLVCYLYQSCSILCYPELQLTDHPASNLGIHQPFHSLCAHPGALGATGIEGRAGWGSWPGMLAAVAVALADVSEMPFKLARGPLRCMYGLDGGRAGGQERSRWRWRGTVSRAPRAAEEMRSHSETDLPSGAGRQVRRCRTWAHTLWYLPVSVSYLFICLSDHSLSAWLTFCLSVFLSVLISLNLSFYRSVSVLSVYMSISIYLSIYPSIWGVNRIVRHDIILILIPSDTIFADSSKNYTISIRYRSLLIDISIYIYIYIYIYILYIYLF